MGSCCVKNEENLANLNLPFKRNVENKNIINLEKNNDQAGETDRPKIINLFFFKSKGPKCPKVPYKLQKEKFKNKFLQQEIKNQNNIEIVEMTEDHVDMGLYQTLSEETQEKEERLRTTSSTRMLGSSAFRESHEIFMRKLSRTDEISNKDSIIRESNLSDCGSIIQEKENLFPDEDYSNADEEIIPNLNNFEFSFDECIRRDSKKRNSVKVLSNKLPSEKNLKYSNSSVYVLKRCSHPSAMVANNKKHSSRSLIENLDTENKVMNENYIGRRERYELYRNTKKYNPGDNYINQNQNPDAEKKLTLLKYRFLFSDVSSNKKLYNSSKNVNFYKNPSDQNPK